MSLRLAIQRSLETSSSKEPEEASAPAPETKRPGRPRKPPIAKAPVVVELPKIDKSIRNTEVSKIDEFGFVETSQTLPQHLIQQLYQEAVENVRRYEEASDQPKRKRQQQSIVEISNALQVDVSEALQERINEAIQAISATTAATMETVFGAKSCNGESNYQGFITETPKLLVTKPGSNPQLPHADDMCTSCVICLIHLKDGQEPTRVAKYGGLTKDYPTGITVACDLCNRMEQLPDVDFRRGVHVTDAKWHCNCSEPHTPYDFEKKVTMAFGELLEEGAPDLCDAYAGSKDAKAGDGLLCLPTLIHRGPGNATSAKDSRYVLFFTMRPIYRNVRHGGVEEAHHKYNPELQIHAPAVLFNHFKRVKRIYEGSGCNLEGYFNPIQSAEAGALSVELAKVKEEKRCERLAAESLRSEVARLREENERLRNVRDTPAKELVSNGEIKEITP
ncbi:hypothetical protein ACHAXT_012877 [Thalassiosira profunda]